MHAVRDRYNNGTQRDQWQFSRVQTTSFLRSSHWRSRSFCSSAEPDPAACSQASTNCFSSDADEMVGCSRMCDHQLLPVSHEVVGKSSTKYYFEFQ